MLTWKDILGIALIIFGFILAIYVGLWVMFIGGIVQVIEGVKGNVQAIDIGIGLARIFCANLVAWIIGGSSFIIGKTLLEDY